MFLCLVSPVVFPQNLEILLPEPEWILDSNTQPLLEREAGLAPEEEELAIQLRPLLVSGDFQAAVEILENTDNSSFSAAMHFVLGQLYLALQQYDNAETAYLATIELMPDFLRAHRGLGVVYLQQERLELARDHISRAIALGANDAQIYAQLSYINLQNGRPWSAISGYQQALFFEPDNPQWQQGLLYALITAGNFEAAEALLEELLAIDANNPELWLQHGNIALNNDDPSAALASLEMAIRLGDTQPGNVMLAGQLHIQAGSLQRGIDLLDSVLTQNIGNYAVLGQTLDWLIQRGEWQYAERLLATVGTRREELTDPQLSSLLTQEARLDQRRNNIQPAIEKLEQALTLDPANGAAMLALAGIYAERQNFSNAAILFTRAETLPAFRGNALLAHAQLAVDQQNYELAIALLGQAQDHYPGRRDISDNIVMLEQLLANQQNP